MLLQKLLSSVTRELVNSQCTLDQIGRESLINFEENAIPPTVWKWSELKLTLPMYFQLLPKNSIYKKTSLAIAPSNNSKNSLTIHIKYVETPQDGEDT